MKLFIITDIIQINLPSNKSLNFETLLAVPDIIAPASDCNERMEEQTARTDSFNVQRPFYAEEEGANFYLYLALYQVLASS